MRTLLKEIIPKNKGIFYYLNSYTEDIWGYISTTNMDLKFYHLYGNRLSNSLLTDLNDTYAWSDCAEILSQMIIQEYSYKWTKLFNTLTLQYNPIEDFKMNNNLTYYGTNNGSNKRTGSISDEEDRSNFTKTTTSTGSFSDTKSGTISNTEDGADYKSKFPEYREHKVTDDYTDGNFKTERKTTGTVLSYNDNDSNLQHENQTLNQIWAFNSSTNPISVSKTHEDSRKIVDYGSNDIGENIKPYTVTDTPSGTHTQVTEDNIVFNKGQGSVENRSESIQYGKQTDTTYDNYNETRTFNELKDKDTYTGKINNKRTYNELKDENENSFSETKNDNENGLRHHTNQELINQERDISYFQFFDIVMKDVADLISLKIY